MSAQIQRSPYRPGVPTPFGTESRQCDSAVAVGAPCSDRSICMAISRRASIPTREGSKKWVASAGLPFGIQVGFPWFASTLEDGLYNLQLNREMLLDPTQWDPKTVVDPIRVWHHQTCKSSLFDSQNWRPNLRYQDILFSSGERIVFTILTCQVNQGDRLRLHQQILLPVPLNETHASRMMGEASRSQEAVEIHRAQRSVFCWVFFDRWSGTNSPKGQILWKCVEKVPPSLFDCTWIQPHAHGSFKPQT